MARRKCTEQEISILLETDSDSNTLDESYVPDKNDCTSSDSSESEKIFNKNKSLLLQNNALRKKQASLRLRLRRSTGQSTYKIDTESEDERPRQSIRNVKLRTLQDENQVPCIRRNTRPIKLPTRYSDYECFSSKSPISQKKQNNCNEKKLSTTPLSTKRKRHINEDIKDSDSNDSDCICINFIPNVSPTRSDISKDNKQDQVPPIEDIKISPKVLRTRSYKCVNKESTQSKRKIIDVNKELLNKETTMDSKMNTMKYESFNTPKGRSRIERNRRGILTVSNNVELTTENESKNNNNEINAICKVAKELSIKSPKEKKDLKSITESSVQNVLSTPKSHRSLKHSALTPSIKMRTEALTKPVTPLQEVRFRLHVSAVPKSLPCREQEFNDIYKFLEGKLMDNSGG